MSYELEKILLVIAQTHLGLSTLDTQNNDSLDFHDISVWKVKEALQAAFIAGCEIGTNPPTVISTEK